jgi:hypothetical protein
MTKKKREVKYINRDFGEFRTSLIDFTKRYFPDTFSDFNESSPGMMILEQMAMVGDVLSYYTDVQLRESMLTSVEERINLHNLASGIGYKVKTTVPASVVIDVYQIVPALGSGDDATPDYRYAQSIDAGMVVTDDDGAFFRTNAIVNFAATSDTSPTDVSIYSNTPDGSVEYYLLKKQVSALSGNVVVDEFDFGEAKQYDKVVLSSDSVSHIVSIVDSDSNVWYEVPYLSQDLIAKEVPNTSFNNPSLSLYNSSTPSLLCYQQVERRFVTRLRSDSTTEIQFGAGTSSESDEEIIPNPHNVGMGLPYYERVVDLALDPKNFLYTRTYGTSPSNTTLTITYQISRGLGDNVVANSLNTIDTINFKDTIYTLDSALLETVRDSISVNNPSPAYGGNNRRDVEQVRLEAMAHFAAQNRAVTYDDYVLRAYAMPSQFGSVAKVHIVQDSQIDTKLSTVTQENPLALNMYCLGYDRNRNFEALNPATKQNLLNYLGKYRMMTDAINIKNAYIVNIGIKFDVIVRRDFNSNEVIFNCIKRLKDIFDNDKMSINQPIYVTQLISEVDHVDGVQSVSELEIVNKYDANDGYSGNVYDIETAMRSRIIYPSLDPMIWEVKFPDRDIEGRVVEF